MDRCLCACDNSYTTYVAWFIEKSQKSSATRNEKKKNGGRTSAGRCRAPGAERERYIEPCTAIRGSLRELPGRINRTEYGSFTDPGETLRGILRPIIRVSNLHSSLELLRL